MDPRKFTAPKKDAAPGTVVAQIATSSDGPKDNTLTPIEGAQQATEGQGDLIQEYLAYLKDNGISEETVLQVLDTIITSGTVQWEFKLFDRVPTVFRLRPAWVNALLVAELERQEPKTFARFSDIVGTYNLAGSLTEYNGKVFKLDSKQDLDEVMQSLQVLPFVVQNQLTRQLALFDRVVTVATSDWAIKNFSKPPLAE